MRCQGKRHADVIEDDVIEVKCNSRVCGAGAGIVVLHRFRVSTDELIDTQKFSDPSQRGTAQPWH